MGLRSVSASRNGCGNATGSTSFQNVWASAPAKIARSSDSAYLPRRGNKQLRILIDRIAVGHAGNVVADDALHAVKVQLRQEIRRQLFRVFHVIFKQPAQHVLCFRLLAFGDRVCVDAGKHERAQLIHGLRHVRLHAERAGQHRVFNHILDQRIDPLRMRVAKNFRAGISASVRIPARMASSISWLMYAMRSDVRTI